MDYQGNYFPEDEDENASKTYKVVKSIFKWTMYGISFLIYGLVFFLIFVNRDSKILEKNYMADFLPEFQNVDTETVEMYELHTKIFMNDDGSMQVYDVDYAKDYEVLELGVKFNAKKLTDGDRGDSLNYQLVDNQGNTYELVNIVRDQGGRYGFSRICFSSVKIDLDSNDLRYDDKNKPRTDVSYKLIVSRKSDDKVLFEFNLYDNTTTFSNTEYE